MPLSSWTKDVQLNKISASLRPSLMKGFLKQILLCWAPNENYKGWTFGVLLCVYEKYKLPHLESRLDHCYLEGTP